MATATSTSTSPPPPLGMDVRVRLSVMMFLQFAVWGAWFVVFFGYLLKMGFNGGETGWIFGNMALGAILSPMLVGLLADRFIASEKLMAILHLAGAAVLYWQAQLGYSSGFAMYFTVSLIYALLYNPTLALSNSIAFTHVPDATRDFPGLRVWGTIGWIVVNFVGGMALDLGSNQPLLLAAALSAVLGVFSLALPATPPTGKPGEPLPFLRAFALFKDYSFAVFFIVSGLITVVLAFYYSNTATYLQQCDGRMIPGTLQGYFGKDEAYKVAEMCPEEGSVTTDKKGRIRSVQRVHLVVTAKDGAVKSSRHVGFPTPVFLEAQFAPDTDTKDLDFKLTSLEAAKSVEIERADDKSEWKAKADTEEPVLKGGSIAHEDIKPGQTLTVTFDRLTINPANTMLWGQVSEMILLPLLPLFLLRFGMKWVLILGMLCWGLRYLLFAAAFPGGAGYSLSFIAIFVGVLLHGICFDFFFAAGFIHVDNTAPKEIRASAQALFALLTYGVGMWLGSILSGYLNQAYTVPSLVPEVNWTGFWRIPAYGVIAAVVVFALLFRIDPKKSEKA